MNINKDVIKLVQRSLNNHFELTLKVDGIAGKKTTASLQRVRAIPTHWQLERQMIAYIQYICDFEGIDAGPIDGYWGPQTEYGYEILKDKLDGKDTQPWRDDEGIGAEFDYTDKWPIQTQESLTAFYGNVGENQVKINLPYPLKIAWAPEKTVTRITCHSRVHQSVLKVLANVKAHYGVTRIQALRLDHWGGCLNVRKMRGGSKWSTHSWGMAMDWDPARKRLKWK